MNYGTKAERHRGAGERIDEKDRVVRYVYTHGCVGAEEIQTVVLHDARGVLRSLVFTGHLMYDKEGKGYRARKKRY